MFLQLISFLFLKSRIRVAVFILATELLSFLIIPGSILGNYLAFILIICQMLIALGVAIIIMRFGLQYSIPLLLLQIGIILFIDIDVISSISSTSSIEGIENTNGSSSGFMLFIYLFFWQSMVIPSIFLRITKSWIVALMAIAVPIGAVVIWWGVISLAPLDPVKSLLLSVEGVNNILESVSENGSADVTLTSMSQVLVNSAIFSYFIFSFLVIVLARYYQSALFFKGAFREEFINIRFPIPLAFSLLILFIVLRYSDYWSFISIICGLLLLTGALSLGHYLVYKSVMPRLVLFIFYVLLFLLLIPILYLSAIISFVDSIQNIRVKLQAKDV